MPKSLGVVKNAEFEDFSNNILTLRVPKGLSNVFTKDLQSQFEELLAQELHKKIRVETIFDETISAAKVTKDTISDKQFLENLLSGDTDSEFSGADDFDIEISNKKNPAEEDLPDFLKYTLKIFETTNFEKIDDEE